MRREAGRLNRTVAFTLSVLEIQWRDLSKNVHELTFIFKELL